MFKADLSKRQVSAVRIRILIMLHIVLHIQCTVLDMDLFIIYQMRNVVGVNYIEVPSGIHVPSDT